MTAHTASRAKFRKTLLTALTILVLSAGALLFLVPFLWMLSTAVKPQEDVWVTPPIWIPNPVIWKNFIKALTVLPFLQYTANTLIITGLCILGTLLSASLVAFGFARLRFPGRDGLFVLLLATMMVPGVVTLIPSFIMFKYLHWIDTFLPLWVPAWFGGSAFAVFMLRQFFLTIPRELDEAATIDGCTTWDIYWRIILPQAKAALGSLAIFVFMYTWNDFLGPLVYINSPEKRTIALGLQAFMGQHRGEWNLLMAASLVFLLPCLLIFFLAQKAFIQGVVVSGVKG